MRIAIQCQRKPIYVKIFRRLKRLNLPKRQYLSGFEGCSILQNEL